MGGGKRRRSRFVRDCPDIAHLARRAEPGYGLNDRPAEGLGEPSLLVVVAIQTKPDRTRHCRKFPGAY